MTARDWIRRRMGRQAWEKVWGPLLRGKFGDRADDIAMVWLWSKLMLRRSIRGGTVREERLGYPRRSWERLFDALRARIGRAGGRVLIDRPAARVDLAEDDRGLVVVPGAPGSFRRGHDPRAFDTLAPEVYDACLCTVPNDVFRGLLGERLGRAVGDEYLGRLDRIEYFTALCLLLEIDRRFSPYYWTNIGDRRLPFVGLVEHTNFVGPERYDGRRFLYVANYLERGHELLDLDADELLDRYDDGLRQVNPDWSGARVRNRWLFREPAGQPIVDVGYRRRMPPLETGVPGLFLANTTQVYPEDRGTNYAVRLGDEVAGRMLS
jgi:protoporphyrinogen oxidase